MDQGYTAQEIRSAGRLAVRYGVDLDEVLQQMDTGDMSSGQLVQLFRLAQDSGMEPSVIDELLDQGYSLNELRQAERLAGGGVTPQEILEIGLQEYRRQLHEKATEETQEGSSTQNNAARLARKHDVSIEEILRMYNEDCGQKWGCVEKAFRNESKGKDGK
jgi:hypothetical protein